MPITSISWWPLDHHRWHEIQLAGHSLAAWIDQLKPKIAHQTQQSWVSPSDWQRLVEAGPGSTLVDTAGQNLASIGKKSDNELAAESSFLITYPWQLIEINEQLLSNLNQSANPDNISKLAHINGKLHLGSNSSILPGVVIEGNVAIGENCKIGPNCYIRGNTSIANGVIIGNAVEIKNCIIGDNTAIGHLSYLGDSVIGDNVNLGAGTIVSNFRHDGTTHHSLVNGELINTNRKKFGTIIGSAAHTGIQTGIYPGRKLGPETTTRPGEIVQTDLKN